MFVRDRVTGELLWLPRNMCFAEAAAEETPPAGEETPPAGEETPPAGEETPPAGEETPPADHWSAGFKDADTKAFAERYTSQEEAAKAGLTFRQQVSERVSVLTDKSTDDEVASFRVAVGAPAEATGYEVVLPEGMAAEDVPDGLKAFHNAMQEVAHKTALSPAQFSAFNVAYNEAMTIDLAAKAASEEQLTAAGMNQLKKDWPGAEFERNAQFSEAGAFQFGGADFLNWVKEAEVEGVKIGNHPQFIRVFASIGRGMAEDPVAAFPAMPANAAALGDQLKSKTSEQMDAIDSGDTRKANSIQVEIDAITSKMAGSGGAVVGAAGRAV